MGNIVRIGRFEGYRVNVLSRFKIIIFRLMEGFGVGWKLVGCVLIVFVR